MHSFPNVDYRGSGLGRFVPIERSNGGISLGQFSGDYAEVIASFHLLRPNATILITRSDTEIGRLNAPMFYTPTLAVHFGNAFVPSLYTLCGVRETASKSRFNIEDSLDYLIIFQRQYRNWPAPRLADRLRLMCANGVRTMITCILSATRWAIFRAI